MKYGRARVYTLIVNDRLARLDHFTTVLPLKGEGPGAVRSHQVAGAGSRFLAGAADLVLQLTLFILIAWFLASHRPGLFPPGSIVWAVPLGLLEWHIIYLMLFEAFTRGITPGKALLRLRVVTLDGNPPRPVALVIRNLLRLADVAAAGYLGSLAMVSLTRRKQRLGDLAAKTLVIYSAPLALQLEKSRVPESLYSTSEDGYLLQAWMTRELTLDEDSRLASAVDLAAYLHSKYDGKDTGRKDPVDYLRQLYDAEAQMDCPILPDAGDTLKAD